MGVDTGKRAAGDLELPQDARRWREATFGILGVDAAFDAGAADGHILLMKWEPFSSSDEDLLADEVEPGCHFGNWVLDLDAAVDLYEVEHPMLVDQEFVGSCTGVAHLFGRSNSRQADLLGQARWQARRGRLFDQLLAPPLDRAVAHAQVQHVAALVAEDLDLDMPCGLQELLDVDARIAKDRLGTRFSLCVGRSKVLSPGHDRHPAAAPAGDSLDDHGIADLVGELQGFANAPRGALAAREHLQTALRGDASRLRLVAEAADHFGRRADKGEPVRLADLGEVGILGQESVTRVDGIGPGLQGGLDDGRGVEIAVPWRGGPNLDRLVRVRYRRCGPVSGRVADDAPDS